MLISLAIDEALLAEAQKAGGLKTQKETVHLALHEFLQRRKQLATLELFGQVDFARGYDYKKAR